MMRIDQLRKYSQKYSRKDRPASAMILTMFILSGMLIVAMSGAYVVWLGIKAGGIQAQSTKAYYAAEAGAERLLYELNYGAFVYEDPSTAVIFSDTLNSGAVYNDYFISSPPLVFQAIGDYQSTKRSVEIRFGD
ncbi:MAG: hypothetical protein WC456_00825 [Patescibacteria group bacterium]